MPQAREAERGGGIASVIASPFRDFRDSRVCAVRKTSLAKIPPMTQPPGEPRVSRHLSRVGKRLIAGYFDPAVPRALKNLALEQDTTMQTLLARAINDLLEKHGRGRPASEAPLPRGGAAQLAPRRSRPGRGHGVRSEYPNARQAEALSRSTVRGPDQPVSGLQGRAMAVGVNQRRSGTPAEIGPTH